MARWPLIFLLVIVVSTLPRYPAEGQSISQIYPPFLAEHLTSMVHAGGDTLYVGGLNFTLLRSVDRGGHWETLFREFGSYDIWRMGFDGTNLVLLPGGRRYYEAMLENARRGFLLRFDPKSGDTSQLSFPVVITGDENETVSFDLSVNRESMFVLTANGEINHLIRSKDQGRSWHEMSLPDSLIPGIYNSISFIDSTTGCIISRGKDDRNYYKLYSTHDGGNNWYSSDAVRFAAIHQRGQPYPVSWVSKYTAFVASENGALYRTEDAGLSWSQQNPTLPTNVRSLAISPRGQGYCVGASMDVYRSLDYGRTWLRIREKSSISDESIGVMVDDSTYYVITADGDRFGTSDAGLTWNHAGIMEYVNIGSYAQFVSRETGYTRAQLKVQDLISEHRRTTDAGRTWHPFNTPLANLANLIPVTEHVVHACKSTADENQPIVIRTVDAGATWAPVLIDTAGSAVVPTPGVLDKLQRGIDTIIIPADEGRILATLDGGNSWRIVQNMQLQPVDRADRIMQYNFNYRTYSWALARSCVLRSEDDGHRWDTVLVRNASLKRLVVLHGAAVAAYSTDIPAEAPSDTRGTLFLTTDGGVSWTERFLRGDDPWGAHQPVLFEDGLGIGILAYQPHVPGGIHHAITRTRNFWETYDTVAVMNSTRSLTITPLDRKTVLINRGNTMYSLSLGTSSVSTRGRDSGVPVIGYNYPNPARTATNVPYNINARQRIRFELYDALGKRVRILRDTEEEPGEHVFRLDTRDLPQGIYFVRIDGQSTHAVITVPIVK